MLQRLAWLLQLEFDCHRQGFDHVRLEWRYQQKSFRPNPDGGRRISPDPKVLTLQQKPSDARRSPGVTGYGLLTVGMGVTQDMGTFQAVGQHQ